ncbi:MAG: N-acetylmuramoyl-L-alanine amidase [Clostridiales bacterium]|nr:N-acetylmuramoyl-L-alanine amidase [Clostridiales bacterium]
MSKKKSALYYIVCILMIAAFIFLMITALYKINVGVSSEAIKSMPTVVIDAGHGGEDGGAVNDEGVLEKDLNLIISNETADLFRFLGFEVIQTRTDDTSLTSEGDTVHSRKVSDMKNRLEIFNSNDNNVVISIHQNKFTESQYYGTQIFYSANNKNSSALAESIRHSVRSLLQPDNTRECKQADSGIYLLNNAQIPAVIVECGFISNPEECAKLLDKEYQKQMAFSVTMGFLNYFSSSE